MWLDIFLFWGKRNCAVLPYVLTYLYTYMAQSAYFVNSKKIELIKVKLTYKCIIAENLSVYGKTCESINYVVCGLLPALEQLLYDRCNSELLTVEQLKSRVWRYFMSYLNNLRICSANGGLSPMVKRNRFYAAQSMAA